MSSHQCYKYLGISETSKSEVSKETLERITSEIANRTENICKTKLNAKNLFKATNEFTISVINYYVGVVNIEPEEFKSIDDKIRQILSKYKVHLQPACKERLYLP